MIVDRNGERMSISNNVYKFFNNKLQIKVDGSSIIMTGEINEKEPGKDLKDFFEELNLYFVDKKINEVSIDVRSLFFLNSSGIKEIIKWVMNLNEIYRKSHGKIKFYCSKDIIWQKPSFVPISNISPGIIYVNEV